MSWFHCIVRTNSSKDNVICSFTNYRHTFVSRHIVIQNFETSKINSRNSGVEYTGIHHHEHSIRYVLIEKKKPNNLLAHPSLYIYNIIFVKNKIYRSIERWYHNRIFWLILQVLFIFINKQPISMAFVFISVWTLIASSGLYYCIKSYDNLDNCTF